jgi:hypothetical protein
LCLSTKTGRAGVSGAVPTAKICIYVKDAYNE